jgi:hypothetical protein
VRLAVPGKETGHSVAWWSTPPLGVAKSQTWHFMKASYRWILHATLATL